MLGGDHSVTFGNGTGLARVHGDGSFGLVHFDAHADTGETNAGQLHGHGTPMRRLIESGAVPGHRFVQIGLRGYWPGPTTVAWMAEQRMETFLMTEITERGLAAVVDDAVASCSGSDSKGIFISVDIDVVDPGMAPGTGTPEPGGHHLARTPRHRSPACTRASCHRGGCRGGLPALRRSRPDHRIPGQPRRPRDSQRNGRTQARRVDARSDADPTVAAGAGVYRSSLSYLTMMQ